MPSTDYDLINAIDSVGEKIANTITSWGFFVCLAIYIHGCHR